LLQRRRWMVPLLDAAAALLAMGCNAGSPASPVHLTPEQVASSAPSSALPIRRIRRLSNREYNNVVRDLLGNPSQPANQFVVDVYQNGYDNGSAGLAVQSDQVVDYQSAAESLASTAVQGRLDLLVHGCQPATDGAQTCLETLIFDFAARAFRRPLTDTEAQRLRDLFGAELQGGASFERGIQTILEVILQSPQFLYREELGGVDEVAANSGAEVPLTDYEVASELSFLLTGSMPDEELWTAVQQGRFRTRQDHSREAARLLATGGAKASLRAFLHQWLATDQLATISKDTNVYPSFSPAISASMASELDQFFDAVLWAGDGSLRELFTSSKSFVDAKLAELYGVPVTASGFQPVVLDAQLRSGVLTRAGFLAAHSAVDSSGPISRGVFLLQSIMCSPPPRPPPDVPPVPAATDPSVQSLTTRQRFDQHVSSARCASCHSRIDGIGFGFEEFDGIGAFRVLDNGQPVDTSGTVIGTGEMDGDFQGVGELTARLSGSRLLAVCFARQVYRYAMGQVEDPKQDLSWLTALSSTDAEMTSAFLAIVDSRVFETRTVE
jgi:hypothetical protein